MRRTCALAVVAVVGALTAPALGAQELNDLGTACAASKPALAPLCANAALLLGATRGGIGLAIAQGSAVPGSASTLGRRMASSPRLAFSVRAGMGRTQYSDPGTASTATIRTIYPTSLEGQLTIGLLEGWSPLPTVGGFLSLDVLGSLGFVTPGGDGFDGNLQDAGYGARVGLFRESFTLPGVSASVMRRHLGDVHWGSDTGDGTEVRYTPTVTSLRATASKEFLAFGVLGGWGVDRYDSPSTITVRRATATANPLVATASADHTHTARQLVYGGLSYTMLVFQVSAEAGWGWTAQAPAGLTGFTPAGTLFGSVAARLTY